MNLTLKHKTRHTYLTINIWMSTFSTFSSLSFSSRLTAMLSLIKRGGNAWSCFFDLSHDLFVLIYIHHLQAASLLAKSSQEPNCSREAWPAETGKKETKHQRSLRGLIELWPHHDLRTRKNETDHYHYLDNLITQILNKFIMLHGKLHTYFLLINDHFRLDIINKERGFTDPSIWRFYWFYFCQALAPNR